MKFKTSFNIISLLTDNRDFDFYILSQRKRQRINRLELVYKWLISFCKVFIFKNRIQTIKICAFLLSVFIDIHNSPVSLLHEKEGTYQSIHQKKFKFSQTIRTSFRFFFLKRIHVLLCKSIASYKSQI